MRRLGDDLLVLALWLWLTIAVGPWWLGVSLFVGAGAINFIWLRRGE